MNILNSYTKSEIKQNIKSMYTGKDKEWYSDYNTFLHKVAKKYNLDFFKVVGIFSVYSTNASLYVNLMLMHRFLLDPYCENTNKNHVGMNSVYQKALNIYKCDGKHETVLQLIEKNYKTGKYLNSFKLRSFYINLVFPKLAYKHNYRGIHKTNYFRFNAITIDRHAICLSLNNDSFNTKGLNKNVYAFIAQCYNEIAKEFNILPQELQASTWIKWRKYTGKEAYSGNEKNIQAQILSI